MKQKQKGPEKRSPCWKINFQSTRLASHFLLVVLNLAYKSGLYVLERKRNKEGIKLRNKKPGFQDPRVCRQASVHGAVTEYQKVNKYVNNNEDKRIKGVNKRLQNNNNNNNN